MNGGGSRASDDRPEGQHRLLAAEIASALVEFYEIAAGAQQDLDAGYMPPELWDAFEALGESLAAFGDLVSEDTGVSVPYQTSASKAVSDLDGDERRAGAGLPAASYIELVGRWTYRVSDWSEVARALTDEGIVLGARDSAEVGRLVYHVLHADGGHPLDRIDPDVIVPRGATVVVLQTDSEDPHSDDPEAAVAGAVGELKYVVQIDPG